MTISILIFILTSSLAWAFFDLGRKLLTASSFSTLQIAVLLMLCQTPIFLIFFQTGQAWHLEIEPYLFPASLCIFLNVFANVLFLVSVRYAPFSLSIPMLSLTPVFTAISGFLFLDEYTGIQQWSGIAIVVSGALILQKPNAAAPITPKARKGILAMVVVALLWSITPVLDKLALPYTTSAIHGAIQCMGIAILLIPVLIFQKQKVIVWPIKPYTKTLVFTVLAAVLALYFQLESIKVFHIGLFEALKRAIGLLASLSFGYFLYKEAIYMRKVMAMVLMGVGCFLILS